MDLVKHLTCSLWLSCQVLYLDILVTDFVPVFPLPLDCCLQIDQTWPVFDFEFCLLISYLCLTFHRNDFVLHMHPEYSWQNALPEHGCSRLYTRVQLAHCPRPHPWDQERCLQEMAPQTQLLFTSLSQLPTQLPVSSPTRVMAQSIITRPNKNARDPAQRQHFLLQCQFYFAYQEGLPKHVLKTRLSGLRRYDRMAVRQSLHMNCLLSSSDMPLIKFQRGAKSVNACLQYSRPTAELPNMHLLQSLIHLHPQLYTTSPMIHQPQTTLQTSFPALLLRTFKWMQVHPISSHYQFSEYFKESHFVMDLVKLCLDILNTLIPVPVFLSLVLLECCLQIDWT